MFPDLAATVALTDSKEDEDKMIELLMESSTNHWYNIYQLVAFVWGVRNFEPLEDQ